VPEHTGRTRLAVAVSVAAVIVGLAGWAWQQDRDGDGLADAAVDGARAAGDPGCGAVLREPAGDAGNHIDDEPIGYGAAPPSFGDHRSRWEVRALTYYDVENRPEAPVLVHNLEHGYNILWYDQTVVDDSAALAHVREIADDYATLGRSRDPGTAFIAAPWTDEDGSAFPGGMHYALTHWYADPTDRTGSRDDELGLTRYCAGISAEVVQQWMVDHPLKDAPEGYPDLM